MFWIACSIFALVYVALVATYLVPRLFGTEACATPLIMRAHWLCRPVTWAGETWDYLSSYAFGCVYVAGILVSRSAEKTGLALSCSAIALMFLEWTIDHVDLRREKKKR